MTPRSALWAKPAPQDGGVATRRVSLTLAALLLLSACGTKTPPTPPNLQLSTASLTFDLQQVGTESTAQTETLTNTGGLELDINSLAITGDAAADFNYGGTCGSKLGAGASCTVNLTFAPSQIGQRTASMTIADNGVEVAQTLSLAGLGGTTGPNATLSPTSWDFGSVAVGQTSGAVAITLSNYGTATLEIAGISASTTFEETDDCTTLASRENCTITATFTPDTTGNFSGSVSITDNSPDSPQAVTLSGVGGSSGSCQAQGEQCYSGHPCCAGLVCVPASTRAFCEPGNGQAAVPLRERF